MSRYRRYFVPGGTFFFTVVTHRRRPFLCEPLARRCLRQAIAEVRKKYPFEMPAMVLLPDHLHAIWNLPPGDDRYDVRWQQIKGRFTEEWLAHGGSEGKVSISRAKRKERGVWQRRFWEHTIRAEHDFERHFDYVHYNPVKHRYVDAPSKWLHSSFRRWVRQGVCDINWGSAKHGPLSFDDFDETAMEM